MIEVQISPEIRASVPQLCVGVVQAAVSNSEENPELWRQIEAEAEKFRQTYDPTTLKARPSIAATRQAYKVLGKDPSRYRPSNEALLRRVLQGKELYRINTIVDLNNLASIRWGYSIGGFDVDRIKGQKLVLGIGREGEAYEGIGRGPLNISCLPVYRDEEGGIGTPTSDHERTKVSLETKELLFLVNGYDGNEADTLACCHDLQQLLRTFAGSDGGTCRLIKATD
ncbi:MAG: hypothetical protein IJ244_06255 [Bacteroidaceae bacterium]|nr:hypothetical protein [Bacteroidaceae bacterium]